MKSVESSVTAERNRVDTIECELGVLQYTIWCVLSFFSKEGKLFQGKHDRCEEKKTHIKI